MEQQIHTRKLERQGKWYADEAARANPRVAGELESHTETGEWKEGYTYQEQTGMRV